MTNPYENVQIGNFLIALGYALHATNRSLSGSINLYQQTPNDARTGDVFGVLNGRYFIIEFKRDESHITKELNKMSIIQLIAKLKSETQSLDTISFKSHLMIFPSWKENKLYYITQPYLLAIKACSESCKNPFEKISTPQLFLDALYDVNINLGCSKNEIIKYIDLLQKCSSSASSSGGRTTMSGLIFCISTDNHELQSYKFQTLDELNVLLQPSLSITQQKSQRKDKDHSFDM